MWIFLGLCFFYLSSGSFVSIIGVDTCQQTSFHLLLMSSLVLLTNCLFISLLAHFALDIFGCDHENLPRKKKYTHVGNVGIAGDLAEKNVISLKLNEIVCWNFLRNLTAWENHQMSHWKCAFTNGCRFLDILLAIALNYIQKFCIFNVIHSRSLTT